MNKIEQFANPPVNIKPRSAFRDSMYWGLRDQDQTGIFGEAGDIFPIAFAIGYHFNKQFTVGKNAINHVNVVSLDLEFKELAALLVLKRKPDITDPKDLWKEIETYAEYGIQVLFNAWKEKKVLEIDAVLENPQI